MLPQPADCSQFRCKRISSLSGRARWSEILLSLSGLYNDKLRKFYSRESHDQSSTFRLIRLQCGEWKVESNQSGATAKAKVADPEGQEAMTAG